MLTADRLRKLLHYDPHTGIFTWRVNKCNKNALAGEVAGCVNGSGYVYITIDGVKYTAGRLAYLYMQGEPVPPDIEIDHHNQIKSDNRWDNLCPLTHQENIAKHHRIAKGASYVGPPRPRPSRPRLVVARSGSPVNDLRKSMANAAARIELAQLLIERDRRKKANSD